MTLYIDIVKLWYFDGEATYTLPITSEDSTTDVSSQIVDLTAGVYNIDIDASSSQIVVDLSTNTITSNVDLEINYISYDISLSSLTNNLTIDPANYQTIPFVKSNGNQEERSVTLYGDATYNRFFNEYYFNFFL